jgi:hypothetical protein
MKLENIFEEKLNKEDLEKKKKRSKELEKILKKNYAETFIKSAERAVNKKFCDDKIKKIKIEYVLNIPIKINIYDYDNNLIHDKKIEEQIMKYLKLKKDANDRNSDRYFAEKKVKPNQTENLLNRSLGEEITEGKVFPYANSNRIGSQRNKYEPSIIKKIKYYPFSIEDDNEKYYFDKHGNSVKHIWNAICFETKKEALDFGKKYLIFGKLDIEEITKTEQHFN